LDNPLAEGVVLADEVGLGKTIEAGLILTQLWAEGKRKLLVVCPASLRKQWALELEEKFHLPTVIIDAKQYRNDKKSGYENPFDRKEVVIASIHYAARRDEELVTVRWDSVVVDEAHKLRNAYREGNKLGRRLLHLLEGRRKLLLTATPLQNSLMELYGLSLFVDRYLFGEPAHFRSIYSGRYAPLKDLRERIRPYFTRTLRRDVLEYVRYTERKALTQPFEPSDIEQELYDALNEYLQRADTYAFPSQHRHLSILIIRKLLASSSHALVQTLEMIRSRLLSLLEEAESEETRDPLEALLSGEELDEDLLDEILEDKEESGEEEADEEEAPDVDPAAVRGEIALVDRFIGLARSIQTDSKAKALLNALAVGFSQMVGMGARKKAVVFTESRRTQEYLRRFLEANGYAGRVVTFNGSNNDPESRGTYHRWVAENEPKGRSSGSRKVDTRTALIERFRDHAQVMIATEAGAEGINLQFCSLVVNYDLPWNPQRIEQRIGRVHRYGQQFDVVVINFLNTRNHADQRVYELLDEKFALFQGVFGASDEVLGALESGVDFEKRILEIYQTCRTPDEIDAAFQALQKELDDQIQARMAEVRQTLLDRFDQDVHERLRLNLEHAKGLVRKTERHFWWLTKYVLADRAAFDDDTYRFTLHDAPIWNAATGEYVLASQRSGDETPSFVYRLSHPLGEWVVRQAKTLETPTAGVSFAPSQAPIRATMAEQLTGQAGHLRVDRLVIQGAETEEYLLVSGVTDDESSLNPEAGEKLFSVPGEVDVSNFSHGSFGFTRLKHEAARHRRAVESASAERNGERLQEERNKLYRWAKDQEEAAEQELENVKQQIMRIQREARQARTVDEQKRYEEKVKQLTTRKRRLRREIFAIEDEIEARRDELLDKLEARVQQVVETEELFTIAWDVRR
jgi:ERCC4-related helicase